MQLFYFIMTALGVAVAIANAINFDALGTISGSAGAALFYWRLQNARRTQ